MPELPEVVLSTFVVRLWRDGGGGQWRGQIVHLPSQATRHFADWPHMLEFLNQHAPDFPATKVDPSGHGL
jgi:hypothetical protein